MNINPAPPLHKLDDTAHLTLKQAHTNNTHFSEVMKTQLQTQASPSPSQHTTKPASVSEADAETKTTKQSDASIEFQNYMAKNDAEKMRLSMLKEMGLTEEEFEQLPPEEQFAIEQKIMARLKQQNGIDSTDLNTAVDPSVFKIS